MKRLTWLSIVLLVACRAGGLASPSVQSFTTDSKPQTNPSTAAIVTPTPLPQTDPKGPIVFTPRTDFHFQVIKYLWLLPVPVGEIEMKVLSFDAAPPRYRLTLEFTRAYSGMQEKESWQVCCDPNGIQADGKPFLPKTAKPGDSWESINGSAEFLSYETIGTPLKIFPNCWKVRYLENGNESTYWFSPGFGLVGADFPALGQTLSARVSQAEL